MRSIGSCGLVAASLALIAPQSVSALGTVASAQAEGGAADGDEDTTSRATPDSDLRTFGGGRCLSEPAGSDQNIGGLAAVLLPQVVGAGIDALTSALEAAGRDRVVSRSTVPPLEYSVRCVQIARGVTMPSRDFRTDQRSASARRALQEAPFLVEFYFRQSRDGSVLAMTVEDVPSRPWRMARSFCWRH